MKDVLFSVLLTIYDIAHIQITFSLSFFIPFLFLWSWLTLKILNKE
jgi:hypothetical protein